MTDEDEKYCCKMRAHFLIGVVGTREGDAPVEAADFIIAFEPKIIMKIKYCPFCGKEMTHDGTLRIGMV